MCTRESRDGSTQTFSSCSECATLRTLTCFYFYPLVAAQTVEALLTHVVDDCDACEARAARVCEICFSRDLVFTFQV